MVPVVVVLVLVVVVVVVVVVVLVIAVVVVEVVGSALGFLSKLQNQRSNTLISTVTAA